MKCPCAIRLVIEGDASDDVVCGVDRIFNLKVLKSNFLLGLRRLDIHVIYVNYARIVKIDLWVLWAFQAALSILRTFLIELANLLNVSLTLGN